MSKTPSRRTITNGANRGHPSHSIHVTIHPRPSQRNTRQHTSEHTIHRRLNRRLPRASLFHNNQAPLPSSTCIIPYTNRTILSHVTTTSRNSQPSHSHRVNSSHHSNSGHTYIRHNSITTIQSQQRITHMLQCKCRTHKTNSKNSTNSTSTTYQPSH